MLTDKLRTGESVDVLFEERKCVSTVKEALDTGQLVLTDPLCRIKADWVPEETMLHIVYFRPSGMFSFMAQFLRFEERGGQSCMELMIKSPISQYQRRDFIRLETALNVLVRLVATGGHLAQRTPADSVRMFLRKPADKAPRPMLNDEMIYACMTADISGGGAKFYARHMFEEGSLLECTFSLKNGMSLSLDGKVLRCVSGLKQDYRYMITIHFVNIDEQVRRKLIQYIFDQRGKEKQRS